MRIVNRVLQTGIIWILVGVRSSTYSFVGRAVLSGFAGPVLCIGCI